MWVEEDPTLVMEYIAENIPREYKKPDEIKKAYEYISKADINFGRARSSRNYGYWKYASDFMGIGVSSAKHETYKKFTKIQTPTIFGLMSRNRGKRNVRDDIADKMFDKMHVSRRVAISMFPYLEIMFQNDELAWEICDFLEIDLDEEDKLVKRFRSRKIPKKVIKKMEKRKAQMHVEERDRRAEELKNQMMDIASEVEETSQEDELPFEIPGVSETPSGESIEEEPIEEEVEEKEEKKGDKQTTLFSF